MGQDRLVYIAMQRGAVTKEDQGDMLVDFGDNHQMLITDKEGVEVFDSTPAIDRLTVEFEREVARLDDVSPLLDEDAVRTHLLGLWSQACRMASQESVNASGLKLEQAHLFVSQALAKCKEFAKTEIQGVYIFR